MNPGLTYVDIIWYCTYSHLVLKVYTLLLASFQWLVYAVYASLHGSQRVQVARARLLHLALPTLMGRLPHDHSEECMTVILLCDWCLNIRTSPQREGGIPERTAIGRTKTTELVPVNAGDSHMQQMREDLSGCSGLPLLGRVVRRCYERVCTDCADCALLQLAVCFLMFFVFKTWTMIC